MDLSTTYLGLTLKNPLVASSCSLTGTPDGARRIEAMGFGALVVRSVFEEHLSAGTDAHLANLRAIRTAVSIPVVASVNCRTREGAAGFVRQVEQTGVAAIELNFYDIPEDAAVTSGQIESAQIALVRHVGASTRLPVAVKMSPYYTALIPFCRNLQDAGVKGLVLFNRFMQPDINIETEHLRFNVNFSRSEDVRLPLRWVAILRGRISADLALNGGVHTASEAIQAILVGANAVCLCSVLYQRHEANPVAAIIDGLRHWLALKGHERLDEMRGAMRTQSFGDRTGFERTHYIRTLSEAK